MNIHKAVVLAAGRGTRMRRRENEVALTAAQSEAADLGLKCMIPVGRPFLDYVLNALADGGVRDVCIIVSPDDRRIRGRYTRELTLSRLRVGFAEQARPDGTAHAILAATDFVGADGTLVLNGDNLYTAQAVAAMCAAGGNAIAAYRASALVEQGNIPRARLRAFALIEADERGLLQRIIEKPGDAARIDDDTRISMNLWAITPPVMDACARVEASPRGEFELAGAIQLALREGQSFRTVPLNEGVLDLTERGDIPVVTQRLRDVMVTL